MRKVISMFSTLALTAAIGWASTSSAQANNSYNYNKTYNGNSCNSTGANGSSAGVVTTFRYGLWSC
jgi:hypothetical protein